jgi:hypothetical protein
MAWILNLGLMRKMRKCANAQNHDVARRTMPTNNHTARRESWIQRFKARFLHGPKMDKAVNQLYRWAREQQMPTGVRQPGLRITSTVTGEVASSRSRGDRPSDPELPTVLVEEQAPEERALGEVLERELASMERRRESRVPYQCLVRYSDGELFATGEIVNISSTGLLIQAGVPLPLGSFIAGAFRPDPSCPGRAVGFRGHVVRQVVDREGTRMGIEFTRLITAHRQEVEQIIDRLARKPRRDPTLLGWKASG